MADRYWVNGTGNWSDTNKWSVSSGSSGGASVPTTADNVFFDNASATGTFTVTITAGSACANFDASGITDPAKKMTLTGISTGSLSVAGSWINPTGTFYASTFSSPITFSSTTTGNTIRTNSVTFASAGNPNIAFNGVGGGWTLLDDFTITGANAVVALTNGALNLGGFTLRTAFFVSNNSNVRSIAFGTTGAVVLSNGSGGVWQLATATNFSYTGNSSVTVNNGSVQHGSTAGGSEANAINVTITGTSNGVTAGSHIRNYTTSPTYAGTSAIALNLYGDMTIGALTNLGSTPTGGTIRGSGTQNITMNGRAVDQPITFSGTGTYNLVDNFTTGSTRLVTLTSGTLNLGANTLTAGTFNSSNSNVRSIAFGTGNITLIGSGTIWTTATSTNFTRTGTPTVNISNNSATATTVTTGSMSEAQALDFNYTTGTYALTDTSAVYRNLNFTGFAGTVPNSARTIYGNLTLAAGPTYTAGTNATTFAATSGTQTVTTNSQTLNYPVTQNNPGATLSLQDNFTLGSTRAYTLTAGTFNVNGKTASVGTFSSTGIATRTLGFGTSSTFTVVGSGATAWNVSGPGLATTGSNSTINMTSASAKTFVGGGFSYSATLNQGGAGTLTISGGNTFAGLTNTVQPATITVTAGTTQSFTGPVTLAGTSGNLITLNSTTPGTRFTFTLPVGAAVSSLSFCSISDCIGYQNSYWRALRTNGCVNAGNNLGWIFAPVSHSAHFGVPLV